MRQLLVSDLTAPVFTAGVLAPGAVCAVGKDATGAEVILGTPGMTLYSDSQEIKFVQGTPEGRNIVSPWINGRDIFSWNGQGYAPQVAQVSSLNFGAVAATVAGQMTLKFTEVNNGVEQFKRKSVTIDVAAGQTAVAIANAFINALAGTTGLPVNGVQYPVQGAPWITVSTANNAASIITVTGSVFSLVNRTELASFGTQSEGIDGLNGTVLTVTVTATPFRGVGVADVVFEYEKSLQGNRAYYQRVELPTPPPTYVDTVTPATYDLYSIQWHNPTPGQINKVDNRRTLTIAMVDGGGVDPEQDAFELALNTYLASVPGAFAAVNI